MNLAGTPVTPTRVTPHRTRAARLLAGIAAFCLFNTANAGQQLLVTGANSNGNAIYDLNLVGTPPLIGNKNGATPINKDGSSHGGFEALVWVPNSYTNTLDLIVADAEKGAIVYYSGPSYGTATTLHTWSKSSAGPSQPNGLSVDAAGDLFVVSSSWSGYPNPGVWVLPFESSACNGNHGWTCYGKPLLVDDTFSGVRTLALAESVVASTTTALWNMGDLLVLVGDSFDARVIVYHKTSIAKVLAGNGPLNGPDATAIPWLRFLQELAVPFGMDVWPPDATHGTSLLFTTLDGRILRFDTTADAFVGNFASGLGPLLQKIKVGTFASTPYAFVAQREPNNGGRILQLGEPPANGGNPILGTLTTGVSEPVGLAVLSGTDSTPAASCVPSCPLLNGAITPMITPPPGAPPPEGNLLMQSCTVPSDPRVTYPGNVWTCNGTQTLDVANYCPGFPSTIIPGSVCGHSGSSGSGFVVFKGTALQFDPASNNYQIQTQQNASVLLPGPKNLGCNPAPGSLVPQLLWTTRSDLIGVEGTEVEGKTFLELSGYCDAPGTVDHELSMFAGGLALNNTASGLPNGLPGYVANKYSNLLAELPEQNIQVSVEGSLKACVQQSQTYFNSGVSGSPNGFSCAVNELVQCHGIVTANLGAFNSNLTPTGGNPSPAYDDDGRLASLFLTINAEVALNSVNSTWPPANVPPCVTLTATPASVPAGSAATLSWISSGVPSGSYCTLSASSGTFETANTHEPANSSGVSTGTLSSPGTYQAMLSCPGTGTATGFATAEVTVSAPTNVMVPAVVGLSQAAATTAITGAGLTVGSITNMSSSTVPSGSVISESPGPGSSVAQGSPVNLVVSSGPAQVAVPNVLGNTQAAATTAITGAGLVLGTVSMATSNTVPSGSVISENPGAGTLVNIGSAVNLVVSSGPPAPAPAILFFTPVTSGPGSPQLVSSATNTYAMTYTNGGSPPGVVDLQWNTSNATACTLSNPNDTGTDGGLNDPNAGTSSAGYLVNPPTVAGGTDTTTYTLSCTSPGIPTPTVATLNLIIGAPAMVTLTASPNPAAIGQTTTLTWTSSGELASDTATTCQFTVGGVSGSLPASGMATSGALTGVYTASITCKSPEFGESANASVAVTLSPTLVSPQALAFGPNGNLYVASYGTGQVLVYAGGTQYEATYGQLVMQPSQTLSAGLTSPVRLAFDQTANATAGNLYVADVGNGTNAASVVAYNSSGVMQSGPYTAVTRPLGVAVDANSRILVADNEGNGNSGPGNVNDIQVLSYSGSFSQIAVLTQDVTGLPFQSVGALQYKSSTGDIAVAIAGSNEVSFYAGAAIDQSSCASVPCPPSPDSGVQPPITGVSGPTGVAFDPAGNIYVTSYSGTPLTAYQAGTATPLSLTLSGAPSPALAQPEGVAVDSTGNIYVSNAPNNVIYVYNPSGVYQYTIGNLTLEAMPYYASGGIATTSAFLNWTAPGLPAGSTCALTSSDGVYKSMPEPLTSFNSVSVTPATSTAPVTYTLTCGSAANASTSTIQVPSATLAPTYVNRAAPPNGQAFTRAPHSVAGSLTSIQYNFNPAGIPSTGTCYFSDGYEFNNYAISAEDASLSYDLPTSIGPGPYTVSYYCTSGGITTNTGTWTLNLY
jgi:sugar lactone lactonase YvrE